MFENPASLFSALGLGYLLLTAWPLAKTDIRERRLPNRLVLPAFPITLLGQVLAGLVGSNWWPMLWAFGTALITFVLALWVNQLGMLGMGDVKLMTAMSLALGWYSAILPALALLVAFLIAGAWALGLLMFRKTSLSASMPLGPYLIAGFACALSVAVWS